MGPEGNTGTRDTSLDQPQPGLRHWEALAQKLELQEVFLIDSDRVYNRIVAQKDKIPDAANCQRCERTLPLEESPYGWPHGQFSFVFAKIPQYYCNGCDCTSFPEPTHAVMAANVEKVIKSHPRSSAPENPEVSPFYNR